MNSFLFLLASAVAAIFVAPISALEDNRAYSPLKSENGNKILLITSAEDLIEFSVNVNDGTNYSGVTVYLDDDIYFTEALSERFESIGINETNLFNGVFDGQGHSISNLKIVGGEANYEGLFGYSSAITVRNLVLDSSCAVKIVVPSYTKTVGGILGHFSGLQGDCLIDSVINMADVALTNAKSYMAGGIIGSANVQDSRVSIKNCANYGTISLCSCSFESYAGGIAGKVYNLHSSYDTVTNCINYGDAEFSGSEYKLYFGGISGSMGAGKIENCVNIGAIQPHSKVKIGSIVGYSGYYRAYPSIKNCYWNGDFNASYCSEESSSISVSDSAKFDINTFELSESVSVGDYEGISLVSALEAFANTYYLGDCSKWMLNKNRATVTFEFNDTSASIALNSQLILAPKLAGAESMMFNGWYTDEACTASFDKTEVSEDITLYGVMAEDKNIYTITLDTRGKAPADEISGRYHATVKLPLDIDDERCKIGWWEYETGEIVPGAFVIPSYNITLYAHWVCYHIETTEEFLDFARLVNHYKFNYGYATVYLDADIDFTEELSNKFEPIGNKVDDENYFCGTFDGQGHTINNLIFSKPTEVVGVFGYSDGITVRNLVVGSSCSYNISYEHSFIDRFVGGIAGYASLYSNFFTFENCVNMAQIHVSVGEGFGIDNLHIGGIAGHINSKWNSGAKNCVNYGAIGYNGKKTRFYVGGIVGYAEDFWSFEVFNCANYGPLNNGTLKSAGAYVGGIAGYANSTKGCIFENCINVGHIPSEADYEGAILGSGYKQWYANITHCFWWNKYRTYPTSYGYKANVDESSREIKVNEDATKELNDYAKKKGWNSWLYLGEKKALTFVMRDVDDEDERRVTIDGRVFVMLMNLADEANRAFSGWFTDSTYDTHFTGSAGTGNHTILYGKYCNMSVSFSAGTYGTVVPSYKGVIYGKTYGELPVPEREGHSFCGWRDEDGELITANSVVVVTETHRVKATFNISKYTLTFDFGNGTKAIYELWYGDEIEYPLIPSRKGYSSWGWNDTVTEMPGRDTTIKVIWEKKSNGSGITPIILVSVLLVLFIVFFLISFYIVTRIKKEVDYISLKNEGAAGVQASDTNEELDVVIDDKEAGIQLDELDDKEK